MKECDPCPIRHTCPPVSYMFSCWHYYIILIHPCHTCSVVRIVDIVLIQHTCSYLTYISTCVTHVCTYHTVHAQKYSVIHVRILGIVLTHVHIQNTCPLVHLCHTYYVSTSNACLQVFICMAVHNRNLVLNFHRHSCDI